MYPFVFIWDDQKTDREWGVGGGGVGGAGAPVKWPQGDLEMLFGGPLSRKKPGKVQ